MHKRLADHTNSALRRWLKMHKALCVLALVAALIGILELGQPIDLSLRLIRNKARQHPASGQVVVIGIDDKSLARFGPWPWNNALIAKVNDRLFAAGADRVFINLQLQGSGTAEDKALVRSIAAHPGKVYAAAAVSADEKSMMPMPELAGKAQTVSTVRWIQAYWNGVAAVPYSKRIDGRLYQTMDAAIARVSGGEDDSFPIDYSIQPRSIPYISIADLLTSPQAAQAVAGKDVLIGFNSDSLGLMLSVPGHGRASSTMIIAMGAETLKQGRPISLGWWPGWLIALCASALVLHGSQRILSRIAGPLSLVAILLLPLALDASHINMDIVAGLVLSIGAMIQLAWRRFGARQRNVGSINPVSGLLTTNAIRHDDGLDDRLLIAARIRHFADVVSTLPPHAEQALTTQIVSRLQFGVGNGQLLHGDDGNFFWLADQAELETVIEQFQALHVIFRNPIRVMNKSFDVDVSFGLDREIEGPLSHRLVSALAAAHSAEQENTCWKLHDPAAAGAKEWSLSLLGELDQALMSGRVWVAYQPKFNLHSRQMCGAEALVRWTHETRGPISPQQFVEMAERHGRIGKLTEFVLNDALALAKRVLSIDPEFQMSVNISPSLLSESGLYGMVIDALARNDLPAHCLILEVTETAAIAEGRIAAQTLAEFEALGVGLSIDDYGTGLSTLEYLRKIPASELKIDRRFTSELCSSPADQVVMKSTIQLAHALGMKACAEGIETAEELYILTGMECDVGQGFHLARPGAADDIISLAGQRDMLRTLHG